MFGRAIWDKLPERIFDNFKNHEGDLSQKLPKPNMGLLVNHTKPHQNNGQLQINTVKGAMSIAINRVIIQ